MNLDIEYKRQHNESFMVLEVDDVYSGYEDRMIEENNINALLKFTKVNINGVQQYNYCISRKENLEDFLEARDITLDVIRRIVLNIKLAFEELARYLIDESHILLTKETVFLEKSNDSFKISLCYYPKDMSGVQEQFRGLMEEFLMLIPGDDRKLTKIIYSAYDLCMKKDYTFEEILECLQEEDEDQELHIEKIDPYEPNIMDDKFEKEDFIPQGDSLAELYETSYEAGVFKKGSIFSTVKNFLNSRIQFKDNNDFVSEDFIVEPDYEIEEKTVLLSDVKPSGKLVYDGQNQEDDFLVNKDIFRIGSGKGNDAILHEKTVSSNHAKIIREGNDYFLSDLNSTNATYLNNQQLAYRRPVKLKIMDKISFANVTYTFM